LVPFFRGSIYKKKVQTENKKIREKIQIRARDPGATAPPPTRGGQATGHRDKNKIQKKEIKKDQ
jgi:hypothetical protein